MFHHFYVVADTAVQAQATSVFQSLWCAYEDHYIEFCCFIFLQ